MAGIPRIHGAAGGGAGVNVTGSAGAFFSGYQPLVLVVAGTNVGTADSVAGDGAITVGNRSKTLKTIQNFASIIMIDNASDVDHVAVIIDGASANRTDGANEIAGDFVGLRAAIRTATAVSGATITYGEQLNSDGTFNIA